MKPAAREERLEPIDELIEEFLQQAWSGQRPSVEGVCRENPILSDTLQQLLPMLQWLEKAAH